MTAKHSATPLPIAIVAENYFSYLLGAANAIGAARSIIDECRLTDFMASDALAGAERFSENIPAFSIFKFVEASEAVIHKQIIGVIDAKAKELGDSLRSIKDDRISPRYIRQLAPACAQKLGVNCEASGAKDVLNDLHGEILALRTTVIQTDYESHSSQLQNNIVFPESEDADPKIDRTYDIVLTGQGHYQANPVSLDPVSPDPVSKSVCFFADDVRGYFDGVLCDVGNGSCFHAAELIRGLIRFHDPKAVTHQFKCWQELCATGREGKPYRAAKKVPYSSLVASHP